MELRKLNILLVLFAALGLLALTGCEIEDDADADSTGGNDTTETNQDTSVEEDTTTELPYRYVRITDQSSPGDGEINAGADIDAVILDKSDGTQAFAETVEGYSHGGGAVEGTELDSEDAVGAPDSFSSYESPETAVCDLDSGYVSLGGQGGFIILGMGAVIESGDTLTVLEVGGCGGNDGAAGIEETVRVDIAVSFDVDAQWVTVGTGEGPIVPSLVNLP